MKGGGNYNTGKSPDNIKECRQRKATTGTLKHCDSRIICQTRRSETISDLEWDDIVFINH